jgi:putative addiction module component (TIGR02574 family)
MNRRRNLIARTPLRKHLVFTFSRFLVFTPASLRRYPRGSTLVFSPDSAARTEYRFSMSKAEILAELPRLTPSERQEIRLKLARLDGEAWLDANEPLTDAEKALLEARLAAYEKDPDAGSSWEETEARIRARLKA